MANKSYVCFRFAWYVAALLIACVAAETCAFQILGIGTDDHLSPTEARNLRAKARFHFSKANEAQAKMFDAEDKDDVDGYEKWLQVMREHDDKMNEAAAKYEELRDYLEAKIWAGELEIKGFDRIYEKSSLSSIMDHLTFRAKH